MKNVLFLIALSSALYFCMAGASLNRVLQRAVTRKLTLFKCPDCVYTTPYKRRFDNHRASHNTARSYPCPLENCLYSGKTPVATLRHLKRKHNIDGDGPVKLSKKAERLRIARAKKRVPCPYQDCPFSARSEQALQRHLQLMRQEVPTPVNRSLTEEELAEQFPFTGLPESDDPPFYESPL